MAAIDHVAEALARLCNQFAGKSLITQLLTALVTPFVSIESTGQQLVTDRDVYTSVGAQQDIIGDIVGQPRNGLSDADYQRYLLARISANKSKATIEDLITISKLILNDLTALITVENQGPAACVVRITVIAVNDTVANTLIDFLRKAAAAGVNLILETQYVLDSDQWTFGRCAFATGVPVIGNTSVAVDSTAGFPFTGSIDIDLGLAVSETKAYTGTTATSFTGVTALTQNHTTGACVSLNGSPGKGMGDTADGSVGGELASARDARYP